jgi:hypothetical protein
LLQNSDKPFATGIEIPSEAERFVIQGLFANPAFTRFYAENRSRISARVYWWPQPTLQSGYLCQHPQAPHLPESYLIQLPCVPARLSDAFAVAHEFCHILLMLEGYPSVKGDERSINTATFLSSLFTDLVINRRLIEQYGFTMPVDAKEELQASIRNLRGRSLPTHPLQYAHWLIEYAYYVMNYQVARGDNAKYPLYVWSKKRFPSLINELDELMAIFRKAGWETPQQQEKLLYFLIERYRLAPFGLRVVTRKPEKTGRPLPHRA